jgi:hypothetical protein
MKRLDMRVPWILVTLATVISLQCAAQPLPSPRAAQPAAALAGPRAEGTPAPASVRDFTTSVQEGHAALDTRAEVLFDN